MVKINQHLLCIRRVSRLMVLLSACGDAQLFRWRHNHRPGSRHASEVISIVAGGLRAGDRVEDL
jgi:hypothetical protein